MHWSIFIQTLKETLTPDEYEAICNALVDFKRRRICAADLIATANNIFLGDKELIAGFNSFLPEEYKIKPSSHGQYNWFDVKKASLDFFNEIRRTYSSDSDETYRKFIGIMERLDRGELGVKKVHEEVDALFKDNPALYLEFTRLFVGFKEEDPTTREKHHSDDDLKEYPPSKKRKNNHEDDEDGEVIMKAVCCSRKKRRNGVSDYEVKLNEWEDRLFEMDMFRSNLTSTISQGEKYLDECCTSRRSCCDMKDYFGMKELSCIVNLYGEVGEDMVDFLRSDPVNVLKNVVLPRLRQKLFESVEFVQDNAYTETIQVG